MYKPLLSIYYFEELLFVERNCPESRKFSYGFEDGI